LKPLRLGIAGLGAASRQILPAASRLPEIEVAAAADIRPEALREFEARYGGRVFSSVRAMCESEAIDAVWIATPNAHHAEHTLLAARNGKHIVVEKPMALSLAEADRMIEAAERARVKLVQGHSKIYDPPVRKAREIVRERRLGRAIQINTWNFNDWLQRPRLASELDTSQGGGIVYRQGPHQADIVRCIGGGKVRSVRAIAGRWDPHFDTEGDFTAFLEFEDGTAATMVFNGYGYFDITELTWGIGESGGLPRPEKRAGRLTAPVEAERKYAIAAHAERREEKPFQPFFGLTLVSCERGVIRQSPRGLLLYFDRGCEEVVCEKGIGRAAELEELLRAVREGRDPFPDGRWGKATLEVCLAILESSRTKREVFLSHQVACPI
jgi:phthalate 4,5-cis-dihydrodiol dehydrogenase